MKSTFHQDLSKEELLGTYLDSYYPFIFKETPFKIKRIRDLNWQHRGVDLVMNSRYHSYFVDEKAQLDYLNKSLPTFAFEISYLKRGNWQAGWLLDGHKWTQIYFLVTNICPKIKGDLSSGLANIKITGIYRYKLIDLLVKRGLNKQRMLELERQIRNGRVEGKISIPELDPKKEGAFFFSKSNKQEQPINLVLKLNFLIRNGVGKILFDLK